MIYFYLQYKLLFAKSESSSNQRKIRAPPNQNPFFPTTKDLLPIEITTHRIKIAQEKIFITNWNKLPPNKINFHQAKMNFHPSPLSSTNSNYHYRKINITVRRTKIDFPKTKTLFAKGGKNFSTSKPSASQLSWKQNYSLRNHSKFRENNHPPKRTHTRKQTTPFINLKTRSRNFPYYRNLKTPALYYPKVFPNKSKKQPSSKTS